MLATNPGLELVDAEPIYRAAKEGIGTCNDGGDFFLMGGRFAFASDQAELLFGSLPPVLLLRRASVQASVLRWALDRLAAELKVLSVVRVFGTASGFI